jgi:hypothetical protein
LKEHITAGALVGKMPIQRCWSWPANHAIAEGREDEYSHTWGLLCDAGGDARVNGIPFSEERTAPWKEGWIETDISLGVHGLEEQ